MNIDLCSAKCRCKHNPRLTEILSSSSNCICQTVKPDYITLGPCAVGYITRHRHRVHAAVFGWIWLKIQADSVCQNKECVFQDAEDNSQSAHEYPSCEVREDEQFIQWNTIFQRSPAWWPMNHQTFLNFDQACRVPTITPLQYPGRKVCHRSSYPPISVASFSYAQTFPIF